MKWSRVITYSLLSAAALAVAIMALTIQVYCDWAFICENTGSHKGYRQWMFGPKTGQWYNKSPLEDFIESHDPNALIHRWTSYMGTGKNIFGMPILFGHGRPGAIHMLNSEILSNWMRHNDAASIRELYDLLVSDDQEKIQERAMEISEEVLEYDNLQK